MKLNIYITIALFTICFTAQTQAQTCTGETVKFKETFGTGNFTAALPAGQTNYNYIPATAKAVCWW
jgi:hypothetical protein